MHCTTAKQCEQVILSLQRRRSIVDAEELLKTNFGKFEPDHTINGSLNISIDELIRSANIETVREETLIDFRKIHQEAVVCIDSLLNMINQMTKIDKNEFWGVFKPTTKKNFKKCKWC